MLAQPYRLPATIRLTNSKFAKTALFSVRYAKNDVEVSRFGFVIRKTVDKRSVVRNKIKRVFRSCIEEKLGKIEPGYDMLFFLEKGIMVTSRDEVCQAIQRLLETRGLLRQAK
jgi:ribonuclease P protein component